VNFGISSFQNFEPI